MLVISLGHCDSKHNSVYWYLVAVGPLTGCQVFDQVSHSPI